MNLGLGVFLGLIFLGFVWLYVSTWQRWRWKRIMVWSFGIVTVPVIAFFAWLWVSDHLNSYPRVEKELWELQPGMTAHEVLFRKGEPNERKGEDKNYWVYETDRVTHVVRMKNDHVWYIQAVTKAGDEGFLPTIQGISNYSTQEDIENRFGKPNAVSTHKDRTRRMLNYLKFGVSFELERNRVTSMMVFDGKTPIRFRAEANDD